MPEFPLRREMLVDPLAIENGKLKVPLAPGLGVLLTPEIEAKYAFREEAVYPCREAPTLLPDDSVWAATCTQAMTMTTGRDSSQGGKRLTPTTWRETTPYVMSIRSSSGPESRPRSVCSG